MEYIWVRPAWGMTDKAPARVHSESLWSMSTGSVSALHEEPDSHSHLCIAAESPPTPQASELAPPTHQTRRIQTRVAGPGSTVSGQGPCTPSELPVRWWRCTAWRSHWWGWGAGFSWTRLALHPAWRASGCWCWTRSILEGRNVDLGDPKNIFTIPDMLVPIHFCLDWESANWLRRRNPIPCIIFAAKWHSHCTEVQFKCFVILIKSWYDGWRFRDLYRNYWKKMLKMVEKQCKCSNFELCFKLFCFILFFYDYSLH